ncbi:MULTISPECIES: DUF3471 domain-containing protein [unclassified Rhizobium]|uniref:DUF3471 domain-containing protein n=1 Tax=unclassified Rhizobium TaxID=2613769 RepID=UPI0016720F03|nr:MULTISPECIES: DUF3471 domain-containing protein [unclassified Rhizobium]
MKLVKETNMAEPLKDTVAWRRYEQMRPRTEIAVDPSLYEEYSGAYETVDGTLSVVSHRDHRLFYRIVGQSDLEIFPESDTAFFMKALPVQITFELNQDRRVRNLTHHQNGWEDYAAKVDLGEVLDFEDEVQQRIKDQQPLPESERIVRRVIDEHARGEPNLENMSPALAVLADEQKEFIRDELEKAAALKALSFKGVSQDGLDVYDAEFENAKIEWGFAVARRGKISHLYLRPTL